MLYPLRRDNLATIADTRKYRVRIASNETVTEDLLVAS
jgi:hypothetical protein